MLYCRLVCFLVVFVEVLKGACLDSCDLKVATRLSCHHFSDSDLTDCQTLYPNVTTVELSWSALEGNLKPNTLLSFRSFEYLVVHGDRKDKKEKGYVEFKLEGMRKSVTALVDRNLLKNESCRKSQQKYRISSKEFASWLAACSFPLHKQGAFSTQLPVNFTKKISANLNTVITPNIKKKVEKIKYSEKKLNKSREKDKEIKTNIIKKILSSSKGNDKINITKTEKNDKTFGNHSMKINLIKKQENQTHLTTFRVENEKEGDVKKGMFGELQEKHKMLRDQISTSRITQISPKTTTLKNQVTLANTASITESSMFLNNREVKSEIHSKAVEKPPYKVVTDFQSVLNYNFTMSPRPKDNKIVKKLLDAPEVLLGQTKYLMIKLQNKNEWLKKELQWYYWLAIILPVLCSVFFIVIIYFLRSSITMSCKKNVSDKNGFLSNSSDNNASMPTGNASLLIPTHPSSYQHLQPNLNAYATEIDQLADNKVDPEKMQDFFSTLFSNKQENDSSNERPEKQKLNSFQETLQSPKKSNDPFASTGSNFNTNNYNQLFHRNSLTKNSQHSNNNNSSECIGSHEEMESYATDDDDDSSYDDDDSKDYESILDQFHMNHQYKKMREQSDKELQAQLHKLGRLKCNY